MPLVSVILPVYNTEKYLPRCIESLLSQTLKDIEIILVDDGSTDGSVALIEAYAQKDERVRLIRQPNSGAGAARNNGLANALGEAVQFLDSDDYFEPDLLETAYYKMVSENADIVVFSAYERDEKTGYEKVLEGSLRINSCPKERPFSPAQMPRSLFNCFRLDVWNKMFRRDFIFEKGVRFQEIRNTNDLAFTMEALATAERISVVDKQLVHYCINRQGSLQYSRDEAPVTFYYAYLEARKRLERIGKYDFFRQSFLFSLLVHIVEKYEKLKTDHGRNEHRTFIIDRAEVDFGLLKYTACYFHNSEWFDKYLVLTGKEDYCKTFQYRFLYAKQFLLCSLNVLYCRIKGLK